jgi:phosphoserine phosphatase
MAVRIYLARHGETQWNRETIFRGSKDIELNENGVQQAEALAGATRDVQFSAVYSSPLSRARKTARISADLHKLDPIIDQKLSDICYGEWEGMTLKQVESKYGELYRQWENQPQTVTFPRGDSLAVVQQNVASFLEEMLEKHDSETILVVAHRAVNKVMLCHLLGLDGSWFFRIWQDTACYNIFDYANNSSVLRLLNDTCHMRDLPLVPKDF